MAVTIPNYVSARWVATLTDTQLLKAERQLHSAFRKQETTEKARSGARYLLLQGPPELVNAWHRWLLASNETRTRGLLVNHAK